MTTLNSKILILLSTYNGEKYLAQQLESIISQTFTDWTLLIRDDGSSDKTLSIIKNYIAKDPRIILSVDNYGNLGVKKSFSTLLHAATNRTEPYIFFSDQDDVWLPEKLASQFNLLTTESNAIPTLIHSDLCLVDRNLNVLFPSFLQYEKLQRNTSSPLNTLLINNYVTGCTVGINRALLNLAYPIPETTFMHDWWCALCAAAIGKIIFDPKITILYRQHGNNVIGGKGILQKLFEFFTFKKGIATRIKNLNLCFAQAQTLLKRIKNNNPHYLLIEKFSQLPLINIVMRYRTAYKLNIKPASMLRSAAFWLLLGLCKKQKGQLREIEYQ